MRHLWFKIKVSLVLWLKYGLQWRDQYMKFGLVTAWGMAETIYQYRENSRSE